MQKILCVFYREIKSESAGKKKELIPENVSWGNLTHLRLRCVTLRSKKRET